MNVLFLCAGYGTRLMKELEGDSAEAMQRKYMLGLPKALLPIAGKTILDRWLDLFKSLNNKLPQQPIVNPKNIYLVCNNHFHGQFLAWAKMSFFPLENIFNDGTMDNSSRLGANRDICAAMEHFDLKFPESRNNLLLVIAGDTLFLKDFEMSDFLAQAFRVFNESQKTGINALVTHYRLQEDWETRLTGILVLEANVRGDEDDEWRDSRLPIAVDFLEKPEPSETDSRLACPCFYVFNRNALSQLKQFLADHANSALESRDATGKFVGWLVKRSKPSVASYPISGRLDIGALGSLVQAEKYFIS